MSVDRRRGGPPDPPRRERDEGWTPYLDRGERVLWEGQPAGGLRFRGSDIFSSLFGLFFMGFAIFWITMASSITSGMSRAPMGMDTFFPLFGIPFVAVGAYMTFGKYFWNAFKRMRTRYALTEKRAMIATNLLGRKLKSYTINEGTRLDYEPGEPATIWFAEEHRRGSKGRSYTVKFGFEYISGGDEVYRMMRKIQQGERT